MAQIFHPSMNTLAKASIFGAVLVVALAGWVGSAVDRSPYSTNQGVVRDQPVPFSHEHHVGGLGIDCRYCHTSVEESGFAGMPSTKTCMSCHSQIWTNAPMLEPVRASWRDNKPIAWTRVNDIPDYAYFDHSIHVAKGVSCVVCHGQIDQMPLMYQAASLQMAWCLDCHRHPEKYLRPRDQVFNMQYDPKTDPALPAEMRSQAALGPELVKRHHVDVKNLSNCYVCHR